MVRAGDESQDAARVTLARKNGEISTRFDTRVGDLEGRIGTS